MNTQSVVSSPTRIQDRLKEHKDWEAGRIECSNKIGMYLLWVVAVVWNGIAIFALIDFLKPESAMPWLFLLFPLIGLLIIWLAIDSTLRWKRFGVSWCEIRGKAGIIGGGLSGVVRTSVNLMPSEDYHVDVQCVETITTGSGKHRRSHSYIRWQQSLVVPHMGKSGPAGIPFSFSLPEGLFETNDSTTKGKVAWRLAMRVPMRGVDFHATFAIPVFK